MDKEFWKCACGAEYTLEVFQDGSGQKTCDNDCGRKRIYDVGTFKGDANLRQSVRDAINLLEQHPAAPLAPMAEAIRILSLGLCNGICPPCDTGENTDCICQPIEGAR